MFQSLRRIVPVILQHIQRETSIASNHATTSLRRYNKISLFYILPFWSELDKPQNRGKFLVAKPVTGFALKIVEFVDFANCPMTHFDCSGKPIARFPLYQV